MTRIISLFILVFGVLSTADYTYAASRCDCSQKLGACTAQIKQQGNQILVSSSVPQCSLVVFYADENPHITNIMDGISSGKWLGPTKNPKLTIDSCDICKDEKYPDEKPPGSDKNSVDSGGNENELIGSWEGEVKCGFDTTNLLLNIDATSDGKLSLSGGISGGADPCPLDDGGQINERVIEFSCTSLGFWKHNLAGKIESPTSMSGILKTRSKFGTEMICKWKADKI